MTITPQCMGTYHEIEERQRAPEFPSPLYHYCYNYTLWDHHLRRCWRTWRFSNIKRVNKNSSLSSQATDCLWWIDMHPGIKKWCPWLQQWISFLTSIISFPTSIIHTDASMFFSVGMTRYKMEVYHMKLDWSNFLGSMFSWSHLLATWAA